MSYSMANPTGPNRGMSPGVNDHHEPGPNCTGCEPTTDPRVRAAAKVIWETSRADEGTISATGANIIAAALAEAGLLADLETRRFGAIFDDLDAARAELAEVEAERTHWQKEASRRGGQAHAQQARAEKAEAREAALREGVRALADDIRVGTADFMESYEKAGEGTSIRMSGETAAMIVQVRAEMESYVRALLGEDQ